MKRITSIIKDIAAVAGLATILGTMLVASISAPAQDLYQIEQTVDHSYSVDIIRIGSGWDAHLHQGQPGTPTRVVVTTTCAQFFEEGAEPHIFEASADGIYVLLRNQMMPRSTRVDIYTSQPLDEIELQGDARLTIGRFDFGTAELDIYADTGAVVVVDSVASSQQATIHLQDATLDLRRFRGRRLTVRARGNSTVNQSTAAGDIDVEKEKLLLSPTAQSTVATSDTTRHIQVERRKHLANEARKLSLMLNLGFDMSEPVCFDGNRYGSPYNTNYAFAIHWTFRINNQPLLQKRIPRLSWNIGLDIMLSTMQLDNVVRAEDRRLVLDDSYGATPPRQTISWWSVGLPITISYKCQWLYPACRNVYFTLTPTLNFNQYLGNKYLNEHDHWKTDGSRIDVLNRFNIRATIGTGWNFGGLEKVEFFIDLLPTFKSSAGAPQTRMMGLTYKF